MTTKRNAAAKRPPRVAGMSVREGAHDDAATVLAMADVAENESADAENDAPATRAAKPSPYPRQEPEDPAEGVSAEECSVDVDETEVVERTRGGRAGLRTLISKLRPRSNSSLVLVTLVVALAGSGVSFWFQQEASALRDNPAAQNQALVASKRTDGLSERVSSSLEKLWSYDHNKLPESVDGARNMAVEPFLDEYQKMRMQILKLAPEQQASVSAKVTRLAVKTLHGDDAVMIAFLNQHASKKASDEQQRAAARLRVEAKNVNGKWMIARVNAF